MLMPASVSSKAATIEYSRRVLASLGQLKRIAGRQCQIRYGLPAQVRTCGPEILAEVGIADTGGAAIAVVEQVDWNSRRTEPILDFTYSTVNSLGASRCELAKVPARSSLKLGRDLEFTHNLRAQ